ncbi:phospholipase D family protein [Variovorax sp. NFACC27]|uniref:phospholipase D family protein n=1 Tax=unclassified Variovorax TaxID=663243 RepID=UPI000899484B|nr:Phosphatidylserine/phosphatidylglycerophosphate/cardiolipin synthase [Variovorax sp. NFACC28]SEG87725.1 Phosphatidylserine/phosphatidylglycerophosphate/cardiolipin synthase [Variovorax sp. NFACC29]SFD27739.1 Phosphatidylserine/phosphatidylglycerophosphate/cardiolipin synthase [Variovorax sp. NFACC26]SFG34268.1 Phosphatidylserine/phosphatidylglycerophosphate/cardiolipin synthase [Variovorax sp. NFACC27]
MTTTCWRAPLAALALVFSMLMGACSSLPPRVSERPVAAIADFRSTPLDAITRKVLPGNEQADDRSGFQLLPYGPTSFATRIELAKLATRSLDVQYYLLAADNTGRALMRELRDAAQRGVRVRLLVDDLYTTGEDELLLALASYPNVQVRLFNPFPGGRGSDLTRFISSGLEFGRINRRMHNKLFVADNVAAVAGGRNMADEYVMNASGSNFIDMDVFAAGPVVRQLSDEFDHYWNSEVVYPVGRIASSALTPGQLRQNFDRLTAAVKPPEAPRIPPDGRIANPVDGEPHSLPLEMLPMLNLPFELAEDRLSPLLWAHAQVLFDPLTKTEGLNERENSIKGTVTEGVIQWFRTSHSSIKMVSPYFVPSDAAVANLAQAQAAGIRIELVTNSLASTDEPWVYVGYWPHIHKLLQSGVAIYELSPTLSVKRGKLGIFGRRTGALHMKNGIVDSKQVFLGSMNLDPRSAHLNTELGLIIDSPDMARQLDSFADAGSAYRLRLDATGRGIEWVEQDDDGKETAYDVPPETTAWQRLKLRLVAPFIPLSLL